MWGNMTLKKILPWVAVTFWMALLFYLSHQPATTSNELSTGLTAVIIQTIEKVIPGVEFDLSWVNHLVRKSAHFMAYLVLGSLVINALKGSRAVGYIGYKLVLLALCICISYAISDEVHQLFVPGRGGQLKDVILDSAGATIGIYVFRYFSLKGTGVR
jgi:VanZ family protein